MAYVTARAPGGLVRILGWPTRHIRWKIILPYAFLTLVLAGLGSYLATNVVTGSLEERFDNQLAESGRVTSDAVVRSERAHLEVVRGVAFTTGVPEQTDAGTGAGLLSLVEPIAVNSGIERLQVLGADGQRLVGLQLEDAGRLQYSSMVGSGEAANWAVTQSVLGGVVDGIGDKYAQIVETSDGFVLYTAGPVTLGDETVGVVLAGTTLATFLSNTTGEALADITVYDFDGSPLSSTFPEAAAGQADEANLTVTDTALLDSVVAGTTMRESRTVWGRDYDVVYSTLQLRGQIIGIYSVALPTDFIFSAGNTTRTQVAVLFGVGIIAVLGIGLLLANRLTHPILRLVKTAARVSSGDLTARSGVRTTDEIGTLATSFDQMTARLQRQHLSTIRALTSAIDARDPYTLGHSVRVGQLSVMVGRELDMGEALLGHLETGGYLHDIGKIGIRDAVLMKPGALTEDERRAINDHPRIGMQILEHVDLPQEVRDFVAGHHERLDGTGYPKGLRAQEVSMVARIAAVSDMYDALTTDRPYRLAMTPEEAMDILRSESGKFLDPDVVRAMYEVLGDWERRRQVEPELRGYKIDLHLTV